ncbi:MAG TPA: branched-chain amino acid ABC transporter substrate-binding protein [Anaerolineae bacterium]|nr:branched-chain amino acid ABC transporter substrate-binding protein [Anaerolineae bacterium]HNU03700.1 branched-chain amino acid ABC transporter substrate-binding protein [Anaerolineae bacterium]
MRKWLIIALLLALALAGCTQQPKGEVTVYVAAPLTGFQANGGQTVLGGARLAAARLNQQGGLLGYTVKIAPMDDESDSDVAVEVATQIGEAVARGDQVLGVIGHYNSGQALAAMEVYKNLPIIVITPTASETSISQRGYDNFFRVNANDAMQAQVDAGFLANTLGAKRVAVLHNDTEYGVGLGREINTALTDLGVEVVLTRQVAEGQERYDAEVSAVQQANPDAIFYAGYEIEAPYLRAALVQAGLTQPMLASDGAFLSATIDEAGGAAEGMYVSAFAPSPVTVADSQWIKDYQAVDFRNPDTYSINGYSALMLLAEGVKKANSLDADKIAAALHGSKVSSLLGQLSFDSRGDLTNPTVYIFQVKDNAFVQVSP